MKRIPTPIIEEVHFSDDGISELKNNVLSKNKEVGDLLFDYPTVYIINNQQNNKYNVYIGETTDIITRTRQHLNVDPNLRDDWREISQATNPKMYVIGHSYFNKSMTLDIENRLMHYFVSVDAVDKVYNRRTNQQNKYYTSEYMDGIFSKIWKQLRVKNKELFPLESVIKDSALFKASPFHKLTEEQLNAKEKIKEKIIKALQKNETGQLIMVSGEAGSGKTVLLSSLFYEVNHLYQEYPENDMLKDIKAYLIVNHEQQLTVYQNIARKLGIMDKANTMVSKPTTFINNHDINQPVDIVIVDEAHLLWTQGKQAYQGKNQLYDLLARAKIVIVVFDKKQVLTTEQYWEDDNILRLEDMARKNDNFISLSNQMRIHGDQNTIKWIRAIIDDQTILNIPKDSLGYEIKVFESANLMHEAILEKSKDEQFGISRITATFDWEYKDKKRPDDSDYWMVKDKEFEIPWNLQLPVSRSEKRKLKGLSWAEQPHTINEVGSTYTVQGFDLNYVGVILGPSVKFRDGKVIFDRDSSYNKKAVQNRTLEDGSKQSFSEELLNNELNVLLTRGVRGLYLYAVDEELQNELLKSQKGEISFGN